jgi:DnaK suppressor protein
MAAKKRSVSKASARPSPKKSRPAARASAKPKAGRKAVARSHANSKQQAKAGKAKPAKSRSKGDTLISTKKFPAATATVARSPAKTPVKAAAPVAPARVAPLPRKASNAPLRSSVGLIHGIPPYQPKAGETYMSERQLEHFRNILIAWKKELMEEVDRTVHHMQDEASNFPDPNDRATQESEFGLELRTRDRERKLLKKIDQALQRIEDGSYGYCEETGEEIGLKRLEARPVATLSVEAQERRELAERQFRDREDGF